ncbi:NAD(P)/FAD-dependent oxidoreductase [Acinetobacter sp. B5B]|uniref:NAD(P)/FAD-dependent oxidoreductase n=1 Tax=Acinetobacter baretiae TaxID=2605383 RepID=UPI0018C25E0A|nr:NAD(P)/FAD-dependent oxidoreductase [Acinetobacter baretiae]MBF7683627.1 NAD(P)/FAD-dependent oxidoreductase [Acinetobacter baretiae]
MDNHFDVIVLGAGAAGLMLAALAGQKKRNVLVLEKANKVGKKILMSGGGKCNFTNLDIEPHHYLCHNPHFVKSALSRYTQWDFIGLVCEHGIEYEERKHGQLFTTKGSKLILNMLLDECEKSQSVSIRTQHDISAVKKQPNGQFTVHTSQGTFSCESVVVATGGLSIPTLGGSGIGYHIAKQFGHQVFDTRAGLVPFTFSDYIKESATKLSGNALDVTLSNSKATFTEAMLFTHRGLSGPSALQLSNYWHAGESFYINFFPRQDLVQFFKEKKQQQAKSLLRTLLLSLTTKNIVLELQKLVWPQDSELAIGQINDQRLQAIAQKLHEFEVKPSGTEGYRTAEVTLGGVDTTEVSSKTMQSNYINGLFFIGEILDVTGHLGGYNFQWAWSSAAAAAEYV